MTGFNHAAVGCIIAVYLPLPVAMPLALASHFLLDALPRYGIPHKLRDKSSLWRVFGVVDFIVAWGVIGGSTLFVWHRPELFVCGVLAASPDFIWVGRIIKNRSFNLSKNQNWFTRWHARIQKYERPWGIYLEVPLAVVLFAWLQYIITS